VVINESKITKSHKRDEEKVVNLRIWRTGGMITGMGKVK
jgi:hypothetical protein